jgi:hypothetical protein
MLEYWINITMAQILLITMGKGPPDDSFYIPAELFNTNGTQKANIPVFHSSSIPILCKAL